MDYLALSNVPRSSVIFIQYFMERVFFISSRPKKYALVHGVPTSNHWRHLLSVGASSALKVKGWCADIDYFAIQIEDNLLFCIVLPILPF